MRWKADRMTGRYPWYRVLWNLLWFLPVQFFRWGFILTLFIQAGAGLATEAIEVTW